MMLLCALRAGLPFSNATSMIPTERVCRDIQVLDKKETRRRNGNKRRERKKKP